MTNLDALKELAESLGVDSEATTSAEAIEEIAGVGGMPKVSAADNGKVLKVVDGEWKAVTVTFAGGAS